MNEHVESVPHANWLYKFCCWFLLKPKEKLTYRELFYLYYGLNKKVLGNEEAGEYATKQILEIYKYHNNNKLPEALENE